MLQTSADAQFVTVSCERIMMYISWLSCKQLLMHSSWLLVVSASWCKFRDFVANTVEALFVTVSCEHIMMHSSWLCCKHLLMHRSWLSCEHITAHSSWLFQTLLMRSSWLLVVSTSRRTVRDYVANICWCTGRDLVVSISRRTVVRDYVANICWCTGRDLVVSISRRTVVRDYVSNTVDGQFVTVSCEHITTHSCSWLCFKHCWCAVRDC